MCFACASRRAARIVCTCAAVAITAVHIREASLTVHGAVQILPNGTPAATSRLGQLTIHPGGRFDLTDNDLVLDDADSVAAAALISSGLLTTTSATPITHLAAVPNRAGDGSPLLATFDGLAVDAAAVLVKYTYKGDTDLDGRITIHDFFAADRGRAQRLAGYQHGDFDYSGGSADASDLMLLDRSFLSQSAALSPVSAASSPVPEPSTLAISLLAPLLLARRRH